MLVSAVDAHDRVLKTVDRKRVLAEGLGFRVVHVLATDGRGLLLLQQLPTGTRHPGRWGATVAGYVLSGETYRAAAARKLAEELHMSKVRPRQIAKFSMQDGNSLKFVRVFQVSLDQPFLPNSRHFASARLQSVAQVQALVRTQPALFTPTFLQVFGAASSALHQHA